MMLESKRAPDAAVAAAVLSLFNRKISSSMLGSATPLTCWNARSRDMFIVD